MFGSHKIIKRTKYAQVRTETKCTIVQEWTQTSAVHLITCRLRPQVYNCSGADSDLRFTIVQVWTKTSGVHGHGPSSAHRILFGEKHEDSLLFLRCGQRILHRGNCHHRCAFVSGNYITYTTRPYTIYTIYTTTSSLSICFR